MSVKHLKFKLDISLEKACYLAIACMLVINNARSVVIKEFLSFTQFIIADHSTRSPNTAENYVTSLLAKMVKAKKLFCKVENDINHYSINTDHNYYSTIKSIAQISNNLKAMLNNFRIMQDNRVDKKADLKNDFKITKTAVKNSDIKVTAYYVKSVDKKVVVTTDLADRIMQVVKENPNIRVSQRNSKNTIIEILSGIKPVSTDKKDFKSAINSILWKVLLKADLVTNERHGTNKSYFYTWKTA